MLQLAFHVGVQQRHIPFAAAPERIAFAAEFVSHLQRLFHLRGGKGEDVGVAARAGAVHEARMREQIGRAPKQFDAGSLLLLFEHLGDRVEVLVRLGQRLTFGRDVAVMEGVVRGAQFFDELEGDTSTVLRVVDRVRAIVPRAQHRARAERVAARASERVPVNHAKAQMLPHGPALDNLAGIVVFEGQRIFRFGPFVRDAFDCRECTSHLLFRNAIGFRLCHFVTRV